MGKFSATDNYLGMGEGHIVCELETNCTWQRNACGSQIDARKFTDSFQKCL